MINRPNFMGLDGFAWWFGVVENRMDPLSLGRCQVRIHGWHSENLLEIPSADLPWAHPVMPLNTNTAGVISVKEGDMVFGFFLDSDDAQFPVMLGIVPGIPESVPRQNKGFSDQRSLEQRVNSPREPSQRVYQSGSSGVKIVEKSIAPRYPDSDLLNESTVSRLARNENMDSTIVQEKIDNVVPYVPLASPSITDVYSSLENVISSDVLGGVLGDGGIDAINVVSQFTVGSGSLGTTAINAVKNVVSDATPSAARTAINAIRTASFSSTSLSSTTSSLSNYSGYYWSEPQTKYAARYPYNHVYQSESGHVVEIDDTPGAERVHNFHRSGTFDEIHPDGTKVTKIVKDRYEIVLSNDNLYVKGDCNITVDGKAKVYVKGDTYLQVDGNMTTKVQGSYTLQSTGNMRFVAPRIDLN